MTFRLLTFFILGLFHQALSKENRPNIIFVLADDLGWAELGCYGNTFHETPHLDQLAKEGVRFTHAYAAAPVCSPYRAAFTNWSTPGPCRVSWITCGPTLPTHYLSVRSPCQRCFATMDIQQEWWVNGTLPVINIKMPSSK
jgi:hypothetical protein